jgi:CRISPR/Cas system-associated exonuclease Cas4 (RecB family)
VISTESTKRTFEHLNVNLGYDDLNTVTTDSGRVYQTPNGKKYPSITTVLGHFGKHKIMEWRKAVGEEEANKVSARAAGRGTALHTICERYIDNMEDIYGEKAMPHVKAMFNSVKKVIDARVGKVYLQEKPLFSDHLRIAGRVDLIAEFDGVISIIDFKTSSRIKSAGDIKDYFEQESAYAIMFEERTKIPVVNLVTIMAVENEKEPLVFKEHRDNHAADLVRKIRLYEQEKGIRYE